MKQTLPFQYNIIVQQLTEGKKKPRFQKSTAFEFL